MRDIERIIVSFAITLLNMCSSLNIVMAKIDQVSTDHIVHHVLTLYALGATPEQIQGQYDNNKSYQRSPEPVDNSIIEHLRDGSQFSRYLGNGRYYHDYLIFFQSQIDKKGYEDVINEYLLKGDERADDMLCRLYAGKPYNNSPNSQLDSLTLYRLPTPDHSSRLRPRIQAAGHHRRSSSASRCSRQLHE